LILEFVLPLLSRLLGDASPEVRSAAATGMVAVSRICAPPDLGPSVLTVVLQLAHDDENEETRMTAASLLSDLCPVCGRDLVCQFVTPEIISLAEDPVFRVRKAAALHLSTVCAVAGEEAAVARLLPAYTRLARDDMYRVRKACAESLVGVASSLPPRVRRELLVPVFGDLLEDNSKFVRNAAMQFLGQFIHSLADGGPEEKEEGAEPYVRAKKRPEFTHHPPN
jgi:serine/threonine-protein phosphatase 4 regulatory subunit 1